MATETLVRHALREKLRLRNWSRRLRHALLTLAGSSDPLMVAVGAAEEESGVRVYHEDSFFGG